VALDYIEQSYDPLGSGPVRAEQDGILNRAAPFQPGGTTYLVCRCLAVRRPRISDEGTEGPVNEEYPCDAAQPRLPWRWLSCRSLLETSSSCVVTRLVDDERHAYDLIAGLVES